MTTQNASDRYRIELSRDALTVLLACLERVSGGDSSPQRSDRIREQVAALMADVSAQTGVVLERIEPRDLTEEAKALRASRCLSHVASLSGKCMRCGAAV